jgi:hypothetical protein
MVTAVLAICGCMSEPELFGLNPLLYSGAYVLYSVDGNELPDTVRTSAFEGVVSGGSLDIDRDGNYWLQLSATGGPLQVRGYTTASGRGDITFYDRDGVTRWTGTLGSTEIVIPDLLGFRAAFMYRGPYRFPQ